MKLRQYREKKRCSVQDLADLFDVSHRTMYYWIKQDADISGPAGSRVITLEKELAREADKNAA